MSANRVLLVDDDEVVRMTLTGVLEQSGFKVTTAANVPEALRLITSEESFDVLLSDLHMPGAGDGLTVVSAMKHSNPRAVTLLLSAFPEMTAAAAAILQQTDEILLKPVDASSLIDVIKQQLSRCAPAKEDHRDCCVDFGARNNQYHPSLARSNRKRTLADVDSDDLRPTLRPSAYPLSRGDPSSPLRSAYRYDGFVTDRRCRARRKPAQARVHGCDVGRRVPNVASQRL